MMEYEFPSKGIGTQIKKKKGGKRMSLENGEVTVTHSGRGRLFSWKMGTRSDDFLRCTLLLP